MFTTEIPNEPISVEGIQFEPGSIFEQLTKIGDPRMARGKRYSLPLILTLIVAAKLCGEDTPVDIADWAKNRAQEIVKELNLTYTRMLQYIPADIRNRQ